MAKTTVLDDRAVATILHGLRMIQENANGPADCVAGCCDHFDEVDEMNDAEIDALCEVIILDSVTVTTDEVHPADAPVLADLEAEALLTAAQEAQTAFWDALKALEDVVGFDTPSTTDLSNYDIESLTEEFADEDDEEEEGGR